MSKLDELNKLEVVESDFDGEEVVYINIDDTPENREILIELGATMEEIDDMQNGLEELDISTFAFEKCGANYYQCGIGFTKHN